MIKKQTTPPTSNFTILDNQILKSNTLSLASKALYSMIKSYPASWIYSIQGLAAHCDNSKTAIKKALCELQTAHIIVCKKTNPTSKAVGNLSVSLCENHQTVNTKKGETKGYVCVPNHLITSKTLSLKEKGLLLLLLCLPATNKASTDELIRFTSTKTYSMRHTTNSLITKGFLKKEIVRNAENKNEALITIYEAPTNTTNTTKTPIAISTDNNNAIRMDETNTTRDIKTPLHAPSPAKKTEELFSLLSNIRDNNSNNITNHSKPTYYALLTATSVKNIIETMMNPPSYADSRHNLPYITTHTNLEDYLTNAIQRQINYECFREKDRSLLDRIISTIKRIYTSPSKSWLISGNETNMFRIQRRVGRLVHEDIAFVIEQLNNHPVSIHHVDAYLTKCLLNANDDRLAKEADDAFAFKMKRLLYANAWRA